MRRIVYMSCTGSSKIFSLFLNLKLQYNLSSNGKGL